jgi:NADH-quinone oxidoreductase subunit H
VHLEGLWEGANEGWWPLLWFMGKVLCFIFLFIWLRGSLPRLRYDQFMDFGWKRLIPISLVWIVAVATVRAVTLDGQVDRSYLLIGIGVVAVLMLGLFFVGNDEEEVEEGAADGSAAAEFDAFAGGYPVPPMPGHSADTGSSVRPLSQEQ